MTGQRRQTGTRERIQDVALDLFIEQGYEKTSLREIAESLGVTKAALYYHFKTKEDIAGSLLDQHYAELDALITWGERQPPGGRTRWEFLNRYIDVAQSSELQKVMRFLQLNQTAVRQLELGTRFQERIERMMEIVTDPNAPFADQLRGRMALLGVHVSFFAGQALHATEEERAQASRDIALSLLPSGDGQDSCSHSR